MKKSKVKSKKQKIIFLLLALFIVLIAETEHSRAEEKAASRSIKVAILPWKINAQEGMEYLKGAVHDMLISRIGTESAIEMIKESSIREALSTDEYGDPADDIAKDIAAKTDADYIVYGSITIIADTISLDAKILAGKKDTAPTFLTSQGKGLENMIPLIDEMARSATDRILSAEGITRGTAMRGETKTYTGKFAAKEKPTATVIDDAFITVESIAVKGIWRSPQLDITIKYFDIADVDKDGKNEVIVVDRHNLFIYRLTGEKLEMVQEFKGSIAVENYGIAIEDMNNNGTPEIYITRIMHGSLNSYVIEYEEGRFNTIASGLKLFIRVIKEPKKRPVLIGQRYNNTTGFFGAMKKLEWKQGDLLETSDIDVPGGLNTYNFEVGDLDGDGNTDVISLDERDYLRVYSKSDGAWKEIWKSGDFYGGSLNRLILGSSPATNSSVDFIGLKARIVYADLDDNGANEIIICRNDPGIIGRYFRKVSSYDKGEMINLTWEGYSLEENWKTKKIDGYIADYTVQDIDSDGKKELVIAVVKEGGRGKSYITAYKLREK